MAEDFIVKAEKRDDLGKGASRRLRRAGKVPAVVYGSGEPESITLSHNEMLRHVEHEAFFSHILSLEVDGSKAERVIVRDLQRHPAKPFIMHVDFQRVKKGQEFTTTVPIHFVNEETAKGVKEQGCIISHQANELNIACIPSKLPEYIEVDVANMVEGDSLHLSDIVFPEGVRSTDLALGEDHDLVVATCVKPRAASEETTESGDDATDAPAAEEGGE